MVARYFISIITYSNIDYEDAKINGPLVAEMFNILGFHQRSRTLDEDDVMQFYGRDRGVEDIEKEDKFMEEDGESQDLLHCLTARDRRIIQRSEQELSQTRNFTRLLPSKGYSRYRSIDRLRRLTSVVSFSVC